MNTRAITPAADTRRQDFWFWRLVATALSYGIFGLGGLLLRLLVFPAQRLLGGTPQVRQRRARHTVYYSFRALITWLRATGVLTLEFRGAERLGAPGQMIIANHPSLLDVVLLMAHIPNANCVVKHSLMRNPCTRGPVAACAYIRNDQSLDMLEQAAQVLRDGQTLIVFPEGTRTPPNASPSFHRGACAIALRGARCITPVAIHMRQRSLGKGEPWYHIPARRVHFTITVGEDIDPQRWRAQYPAPIAGRKMNAVLHAWFAQALATTPPAPPRLPNLQPLKHSAMPTSLEQDLKRLIIDTLDLEDITPEDIAADAPLFGDGLGLDSVDALELGLALQKHYGMTIDPQAQNMHEHFATITTLAALVRKQRGTSGL